MIWWQQIRADIDWLVHFKAPVYSFISSASEARMLLTSEWRKGTSHMRVRVSSREGYKHPSYVLRLSQRRREGRKAGRLPALLSSDLPRWARYLGDHMFWIPPKSHCFSPWCLGRVPSWLESHFWEGDPETLGLWCPQEHLMSRCWLAGNLWG